MQTTMNNFFENSIQKIHQTDLTFIRYAMHQIKWDSRLIIITGARGVGKTTLLLQYIKKNLPLNESVLYLSADELYYRKSNLVDFVDEFVKNGGKYLFIDEVHKSPEWSNEIKIIYDRHTTLKIVATGSSAIELQQGSGDLSRRALFYEMQGMSFREYLSFAYGFAFDVLPFGDIKTKSLEFSLTVCDKIKPLPLFREYLSKGYYPFCKETEYHKRIQQVINLIIETDIPAVFNIDYTSVHKMRLLLGQLASMVPFRLNV